MRKLIVWDWLSLDGVMEAPETWLGPYQSPDVAEYSKAQALAGGGILLGRVTYEGFAAYWPSQANDEFGINSAPKYVVSSTLHKAEWNNSTLIKKNVEKEIARLKQQPGGHIAILGSATLLQSLMRTDLIDEIQLLVCPVVLGVGKRLFKEGSAKKALTLVETRTFSSGVVMLTYQPDGKG